MAGEVQTKEVNLKVLEPNLYLILDGKTQILEPQTNLGFVLFQVDIDFHMEQLII